MIYNVLVSGVQSESLIHVSIYPLFLKILFLIGHHRVLSRVPSAIQMVFLLAIYLIYSCVYVRPNLPVNSFSPCCEPIYILLLIWTLLTCINNLVFCFALTCWKLSIYSLLLTIWVDVNLISPVYLQPVFLIPLFLSFILFVCVLVNYLILSVASLEI